MRNKKSNNENAVPFSKKELQNGTKALLSNVGKLDDFVSLFQVGGNNKRDQRKLMNACIPIVDNSFFDTLESIVHDCIQQQDFVPAEAFVDDEPTHNSNDIQIDARAKQNLQLLQYAAECVKIRLLGKNAKSLQDSPWELCIALHDALRDMDPDWGVEAAAACHAITTLCEAAYLQNVKSKELIILNALPSLLEGALQTKTDLKRLYAIRDALTLIDFESAESKPFSSLLLRLVSIPLCLKSVEGKRLVSYLIRIGLSQQIHRSIRAQIPGNKPSILKDYGDIYYQAWKDCEENEPERDMVETDIYQDLVYALVHAAKPQLVKSLLCVLEPLHSHQNKPEVEAFLYRLYGPLLWRALSATNEHVRANAVQVLGYVFPLRDPVEDNAETKNPLARAFAAMETALEDESPVVRAEASAATAIVLTNFWDVIPPRDIRRLLNCKFS